MHNKVLFNNLNIHNASGPDGLSGRLLKFSSGIAPVLTLLYNEGTVPDDWRQENVAPGGGGVSKGEKYNAVNVNDYPK